MITNIINLLKDKATQALNLAVHGSGATALYLCTSVLLAGALLAVYYAHAWDVDKKKLFKALAVLQGLDIAEMQQAAADKIADMSYDEVREWRAKRDLRDDYNREITQQMGSFTLPPEDPKPAPPPPPSDAARIGAYEQRVKTDVAKSKAAGLADETDLIENMPPDDAKEVIRRLWKEAPTRVLQMLNAMEDRRRKSILYAMETSNDEELKDLCEILQRIGDGAPMTSIIENAAKEP
jgi:hypothetical protein